MNEESTKFDKSQSQIRKGLLEFCILLIIGRGEIYTSDILEELKAADMIVVEGTIYPLLSRLKTTELVKYTWAESKQGPPRKYYSLTDKGQQALKQTQQGWANLNKSINHLIKAYEKNN